MLPAGHQLGAYRVISPLGAGGMGEVYLAEDTRLRRRVALKVLPAATGDDAVSRRRLLREAQAAATLDHPNICTVYDVGDADGHSFIAMQYIEGETLAARMHRRALDERTTLAIGAQVAAALGEAHRQGIIHRDIKPQNVMITTSGQIKVLDFGLAKVVAPAGSGSETATLLTEANAIAGTVPYMSPEQLRGEPLDARSDIFSLGTTLYELASGAHPFAANTSADTMAAILTREPPSLADSAASGELRRIIRKCLDKDRDRRYQSMRDLAIDLENAGRDVSAPASQPSDPKTAPIAVPAGAASSRRRWGAAAVIGAGLLLAVAGGLFLLFRPQPAATISSADFVQITNFPDAASAPALSPDGRMIAFIRGGWFLDPRGQIYVKLLPDGDAKQLTDDDLPKYGPTFTADGTRVTYTALTGYGAASMSWDTWSVPVLGGAPTKVMPNAAGLTWIDARHVLFSEVEAGTGLHMGVMTATEDRGSERRVYFPSHNRAMAHLSALSPDRKWILVVQMAGTGQFEECQLVPFEGAAPARVVGPAGRCTAAAWSTDGRWMYFSVGSSATSHLYRQRFPDGAPEQLTAGDVSGEEGVAVAADGRSLITSVGQIRRSLWFHDSSGDRLVPLEGNVLQAAPSTSNTRAFCLIGGSSGAAGLSVVDLASGKVDRLLTEYRMIDFAVSKDEKRLVFAAVGDQGRPQIWTASFDRSVSPTQIAQDGDQIAFGTDAEVIYRSVSSTINYLYRVDAGGHAVRISEQPIIDLSGVSPDGKWAIVAALTTEGTSGMRTVAIDIHTGDVKPLCKNQCDASWSPDGRIFYAGLRTGGDYAAFAFTLAPGKVLPDWPAGTSLDAYRWDGRPGVVTLDRAGILPGPDPTVFAFTKASDLRNLFRVNLR